MEKDVLFAHAKRVDGSRGQNLGCVGSANGILSVVP